MGSIHCQTKGNSPTLVAKEKTFDTTPQTLSQKTYSLEGPLGGSSQNQKE
jgi:hypothetical protein